MKIFSEGEYKIKNHTTNQAQLYQKDTLYMMNSLGKRSEAYSVSIPYPNGFYRAKLTSLSDPQKQRTHTILLSPQIASDTTSPIVSLSEKIRVPVYGTRQIELDEVITELSSYNVRIDADANTDANGNGILDDDFETPDNRIKIENNALHLGQFEAP